MPATHQHQPKEPVTPGHPKYLALNSCGRTPAAAPGILGNEPADEDQGGLHAPQSRRADLGTQARENTKGSLALPSKLCHPVNRDQATLPVRHLAGYPVNTYLLGDRVEPAKQRQTRVGDKRHDMALALNRPQLERQRGT
jgi:hypothetical protein